MTGSIVVALLVVVSGGLALVKLTGRWRRRRGRALLRGEPPVREAHDVDGRVHLFRTPPWHGMLPGRAHPVRVDLLLAASRVVLASDQGVLAEVTTATARPLKSARCTGPRRLVVEGEVVLAGKPPGLWRLELLLDDAEGWAHALRPFVADDGGGYGTWGERPAVS
ncbi:MAG: hypothetical protein H6732_03595 [Alphaproteobacteria bacterium]|nr:hypothetical protein [Alphaproteobacteria bacterium]